LENRFCLFWKNRPVELTTASAMMRLFAMTRKLLLLLLLVCVVERVATQRMTMHAEDYLEMGDKMMSESGEYEQAIQYYKDGIEALTDDESPLTILSLHTNLATAFSSVGKEEEAMEEYQIAIAEYTNEIEDVVDKDMKAFMTEIAASASFFLGMVLQDLGEIQKAVDAYGYAINLDPMNWAAVANLASIFHDQMNNHEEALIAYNRAYEILTQTEDDITDPPADPSFILSEIQYRIGLCLIHDPSRKCAVEGDPEAMVSCKEMATHAFSLAVKFNPENESAKHMLATVTADATMKRASNLYVEKLFDDYAQK
jgi:tetratricopeptide (TPR) repeat protein